MSLSGFTLQVAIRMSNLVVTLQLVFVGVEVGVLPLALRVVSHGTLTMFFSWSPRFRIVCLCRRTVSIPSLVPLKCLPETLEAKVHDAIT